MSRPLAATAAAALAALAAACGRSGAARDDAAAAADAPADAADADDAPGDAGPRRCASPRTGTSVTMRRLGRVTGPAVLAASPPGDRRVFVVEQRGAIRIFDRFGALRGTPFLDLGDDAGGPVTSGGELGLLGLAFHPRYAETGEFYVFYTAGPLTALRDVLARCTVRPDDPDRADPACTEVLAIPDFGSTHNGGMIEFGADGYLYLGTGDGGGIGDPHENAQALVDGAPRPETVALLGKLLRIDVDRRAPGAPYAIPPGNPYAAGGGAPEILARGLRNPWRWSFDRATGDLWIADVGQDQREELTVVPPAALPGANFGWRMYEGTRCYAPPCDPAGVAFPHDERLHTDGWAAIVGGQVYRGSCYPDLVGSYFYTDYLAGGLVRATLRPDGTLAREALPGPFPASPTSLHEAAGGELYLTTATGDVYRLEVR